MRNKLDNKYVTRIIRKYDIIWIGEMKLDSNPHVPGYKPFRNTLRYTTHGGICMYVKNSFVQFIDAVTFYNDDVIYVTLNFLPDVTFCACYSPPSDSHYYDVGVFANISSTIMESNNMFMFTWVSKGIDKYKQTLIFYFLCTKSYPTRNGRFFI